MPILQVPKSHISLENKRFSETTQDFWGEMPKNGVEGIAPKRTARYEADSPR